jgi:hypothetical protein
LYGAVVNYIGQPILEVDTPANRAHIAKHKSEQAAAAALAAADAEASGQTAPPGMMTSWEEEGGPDVAGSGLSALGLERLKPLIKEQVAMKNREQITESLFTGGVECHVLVTIG